jgi:putative ABC transport system permease protein
LLKSPGFAIVAILTLGLGIGVNTAVFSVANAVLLKPLPFPAADRLYFLTESSRQRNLSGSAIASGDFFDWREQARSFSGLAAQTFVAFTYSEHGGAVRVDGFAVSHGFFDVLGVSPLMGRTFRAEEDWAGSDAEVVISDGFWRRALGGDQQIVGKQIRLNSRPFTIVGVVPSSTNLGFGQGDIWKPAGWDSAAREDRALRQYFAVGRLRQGVTASQAQAEMTAIAARLAEKYPASNSDWTADMQDFGSLLFAGASSQVWLLLAISGAVLLIGCVNLASLFSARIGARAPEVATRLAIGASRWELARSLLAESLLVSLAGGALGVWLASISIPLLLRLIPQGLPRAEDASVDGITLAFTAAAAIAAGLLFGAVPVWRATRLEIQSNLKDQARGSSRGRAGGRYLDGLVVAEVALSMVLLVGAALLMRSFVALRSVDPGFKSDHVLVNTQLVLPVDKYDTVPKRQQFFLRLFDRIRALPGVRSAGGITALPLQGNSATNGYRIVGAEQAARGRERGAVMNVVTEGYFETMSIPLLRGRLFTEGDQRVSAHVAVINETLAKKEFPDRDAIGQSLILPGDPMPATIVGIVAGSRQFGLGRPPLPEIFTPFQQSRASFMYVVVRTEGKPENIAPAIRLEVAALDPDQPVGHRTLDEQMNRAVAQPKLLMQLLSLFAGLALTLAVVGIYGVTSYGVGQRTQEIGIRAALGARPANILGMVLSQTARLALLGLTAGSIIAILLRNAIGRFLFGIHSVDAMTYAIAGAALLAAALLASYLPAWRAARLDALAAMRNE